MLYILCSVSDVKVLIRFKITHHFIKESNDTSFQKKNLPIIYKYMQQKSLIVCAGKSNCTLDKTQSLYVLDYQYNIKECFEHETQLINEVQMNKI